MVFSGVDKRQRKDVFSSLDIPHWLSSIYWKAHPLYTPLGLTFIINQVAIHTCSFFILTFLPYLSIPCQYQLAEILQHYNKSSYLRFWLPQLGCSSGLSWLIYVLCISKYVLKSACQFPESIFRYFTWSINQYGLYYNLQTIRSSKNMYMYLSSLFLSTNVFQFSV